MRTHLLIFGLMLWSAAAAQAQISVEVVLDQDQYLRDEPLPAHVRITNRSGQTLHLGRDNDWLSLVVESTEGVVVARLAPVAVTGEFDLDSASVAKRQVDLTPSFDLEQPGRYQVTATVRIKEWDREITSKPHAFEVVRGTKLWEQEFGVPIENAAPETRKYTLQQANYRKQLQLYLRVTDASDQRVFRVFALGPLVSFNQPEAQLDKTGYLHVLFQTGARGFLFTVIGPEGDMIIRQSYDYTSTRPTLRASDEGRIFVQGGMRRLTAEDIPPSLTSVKAGVAPRPAVGVSTNISPAPPKDDDSKRKK